MVAPTFTGTGQWGVAVPAFIASPGLAEPALGAPSTSVSSVFNAPAQTAAASINVGTAYAAPWATGNSLVVVTASPIAATTQVSTATAQAGSGAFPLFTAAPMAMVAPSVGTQPAALAVATPPPFAPTTAFPVVTATAVATLAPTVTAQPQPVALAAAGTYQAAGSGASPQVSLRGGSGGGSGSAAMSFVSGSAEAEKSLVDNQSSGMPLTSVFLVLFALVSFFLYRRYAKSQSASNKGISFGGSAGYRTVSATPRGIDSIGDEDFGEEFGLRSPNAASVHEERKFVGRSTNGPAAAVYGRQATSSGSASSGASQVAANAKTEVKSTFAQEIDFLDDLDFS